MNKYNPMHMGCHIEMPREIILKKAVINVYDGQCVLRVIGGSHSVERNADRKSYSHYDSIKSRRYRVSDDFKRQIWTFERGVDQCIQKWTGPSSTAHRWQEGEACQSPIPTRFTQRQPRPLCVNQELVASRRLVEKRIRNIFAIYKYDKKKSQ